MAFEGIYMIADLEKQEDLDFGGAPVPRLGPEAAAWAGSHNLCLGADLDGRELEAAWRFIRYLSDHSLEWAEGGQVPARASLRNTERFAEMEVQAAFARQLPYVVYIPKVPFVFEYYAAFDAAVERILRGSEPPAQALERADAELEEDIARREEMLRRAEGLAE
jgi:multiple sugar transport system substrate-binding protein